LNEIRRWPVWPFILLAVLVVLVGTAAAFAAIFDNGIFEVELNGDSEITLEYGESYEELGAQASFSSSVFGNSIIAQSIVPSGTVKPDVLGTYTLTYEANHYWHKATATRTVRIVDTQKPTIVLMYKEDSYTLPGQEYVEEGFVAEDNYDGDITAQVQRIVEENRIIYRVQDSSGNFVEVTRPVKYGDYTAPVLTLKGDSQVTITAGTKYEDPGFTALDNVEGDVSAKVTVTGSYDIYAAGTYVLTYSVTDNFGNTAEVTRTIVVEPLKQPDVVTPDGKVIYLTFDDGPSVHTERLLAVLEKYNVKATFFVVKTGYLKVLPKITAAGHAIAIHSLSHDYEDIYSSVEAYFEDLHAMESIIYERTGVKTTLLRFPGGSSNGVSKKHCKGIMTKLTQAVQDQGYQYFDWNVDSKDAGGETGAKTADEVFEYVTKGVSGRKISVVLQHDIKGFSVDAVERIIQWGLANGYTFLPLDASSPTCHHKVNN